MILDQIANASCYYGLDSIWQHALRTMETCQESDFADGSRVDDRGIRFLPSAYETHYPAGCALEAHRLYADLVFLLEGEETIYYKPTAALRRITAEYDSDRDVLLADLDRDAIPIILKPGYFAIFMPQDAHCPGCVSGAPRPVRKVVIKVPIGK